MAVAGIIVDMPFGYDGSVEKFEKRDECRKVIPGK
jgi:hypothetical protein